MPSVTHWKEVSCIELYVQIYNTDLQYNMEKVTDDKYLVDILSSDGSNTAKLKERIGKGIGMITDIMSILDTISFGHHYFRIFIMLREAKFINAILTNADIWFGIKESEMKQFEDLDRMLLRKAMKCPATTPKEACHLELGLLPINCILKARRVNYLHYIARCKNDEMLKKFYKAMKENPSQDDWSETVSEDLCDLNIKEDLEYMREMSEERFKKMVKLSVCEYALDQLNEEKFSHSKMDSLVYTELKIQNYLVSEDILVSQKRNIFLFRTRMAEYGQNYPAGFHTIPCKMCGLHTDCQTHSTNCKETMRKVRVHGNYNEIYTDNISKNTALMLQQILEVRKKQDELS